MNAQLEKLKQILIVITVLSESFKMFTLGQINGLDSQLVSLLSGFINRTSLSLVGDLNILYVPVYISFVNSMGTFIVKSLYSMAHKFFMDFIGHA